MPSDLGCGAKERRRKKELWQLPEGTRPLGRPGHRWEDNIKMNL